MGVVPVTTPYSTFFSSLFEFSLSLLAADLFSEDFLFVLSFDSRAAAAAGTELSAVFERLRDFAVFVSFRDLSGFSASGCFGNPPPTLMTVDPVGLTRISSSCILSVDFLGPTLDILSDFQVFPLKEL